MGRRGQLLAFNALFVGACGVDYGIGFDEASDDADPPEASAQHDLQGIPRARCTVTPNPVAPPWETATWADDGSYDPDGLSIVNRLWTLSEKPPGSAATMPANLGEDAVPDFAPDVVGDYVATLRVVDRDGQISEPCHTTLSARPAQNLWIEMYWAKPLDDMDLHLIADDPRNFGDDELDCHFRNCRDAFDDAHRLNWGSSYLYRDDPHKDFDDVRGTGPENVQIEQPAVGTYYVAVHDFCHDTEAEPDETWVDEYVFHNLITVRVFIDGAMVWSDSKHLSGEDRIAWFAKIDWTVGAVSSVTEDDLPDDLPALGSQPGWARPIGCSDPDPGIGAP